MIGQSWLKRLRIDLELIATRIPIVSPELHLLPTHPSNCASDISFIILHRDSFFCSKSLQVSINYDFEHLQRIKMAIYSSVPPPEQQAPLASQAQQVVESANLTGGLATLSISPSTRRNVSLTIPLDAEVEALKAVKARKEPLRRDSMKRREALLKGKEGSRRRQRWENGMSIAS
jgi:hypothetical protein